MCKNRSLRKSIYTIIIFISIAFFCSLGFSAIQSMIIDSITNGTYKDIDSIKFNSKGLGKISSDEVIDIIKSIDDIYIEKGELMAGSYSGKAVYFNTKVNNMPNITSGRYLEKEDFESNIPVAIVGKELFEEIAINKNGEQYFEYENVLYKIIGIMGYEDRSSICDFQFIINLNNYIESSNSIIYTQNILINNNDKYEEVIGKLKEKNDDISFEIINENNNVTNSLSSSSEILILFSIVICLIFMNIFNITIQWIEKKKKEIGIKKALGGTNFKISCEIILENQKLALISFICGYLIYIFIIKLNLISILNSKIYFISSVIAFVFSSFIALITALIAIRRVLTIQPSIIMRGGKK